MELSEGSLSTIMNGGQVDAPIMQILGSKKISGAGDNERYRLLVSDGVHVNSFAMLATQLNDKIRNGDLVDNTIIRIKRYITSIVPNSGKGEKRVMIILDVEVVSPGSEVGCRIGNPSSWAGDGSAVQPANRGAENGHSAARTPQNPPRAEPAPPKPSPSPAPATSNGAANNSRGGFGGGYGNNIRSPSRGMGGMELTPTSQSHPIASLTPYQNKWVIKARVTAKTTIRSWSNSKGDGTLFSFDLVDESGEIRATAFREQCEKFFDLIEVGKVFLISKATLKTANKKFSALNNDYEMNLNSDTQILPVHEEDSGIPQIKFNFVPLSEIESMEPQTVVDVIGVVKAPGEVVTITAKSTLKEFKKRDVTIVDKSNTAVHLTLWGQLAEDFDASSQPVVAVRGGRVNEFGGGKSISLSANATFQVNPDIPESHQLKGWFDTEGSSASFKSISTRTGGPGMGSDSSPITLKEARDQGLGNGKTDYFSSKASIIMMKSENAIYQACSNANCNKKVQDLQNGLYRCERCNKEAPNYKPRILLSMNIGDWSDHTWVTLFQENAEVVLEQTAEALDDLKKENPEAYQQVFQQATFKSYNFRLRAEVQNYNDEQRLRTTVVGVKKIDHKTYCASLLSQLKELTGMGSVC